MRVCGISEQKSGNEKVEIHGPGSFFIDDTIHDGAEQKSFFLGWFLRIFQNIIDVFYLFPENNVSLTSEITISLFLQL